MSFLGEIKRRAVVILAFLVRRLEITPNLRSCLYRTESFLFQAALNNPFFAVLEEPHGPNS